MQPLYYGILKSSTSSLLTGLVEYWKFNETSGTSLIGSHNAIVANAAGAITVGATGKLSYGLGFSGRTNEAAVQLPNNFALSKFTNLFSASMWVKWNSLPTSGATSVLFNFLSTTGGWRIYAELQNNNRIGFWFLPTIRNWNEMITSSVITDTTNFMHIMTIVNGIGNPMKIYINNVDVTYAAFTPIANVDSDLGGLNDCIGDGYYNSGNTIDAIIDEVGFWNKALTSTERATLFNAGTGKTYPFN